MNLSLILHPLDYSGAKPALARALALAKWHEADLHLLHVRSSRRGIEVRRLHTRVCGSSWRRATRKVSCSRQSFSPGIP